MSRRRASVKREIIPDPKYRDKILTKFMNSLMINGEKSVAEKVIYSAFDKVSKQLSQNPLKIFHDAIANVSPSIEVRSRRVGGATYQVPVEVRPDRSQALAIRWIVAASRKRSESAMKDRLASELMDAAENRGASVKKREDTHKMADANRAFSHYRW